MWARFAVTIADEVRRELLGAAKREPAPDCQDDRVQIPGTSASTSEHGTRVLVYGAYGHTGRFVVDRLLSRGLTPLLAGRDAGRIAELSQQYPSLDVSVFALTDDELVDRGIDGAALVINCAGPFASTTAPLLEAALRARIPYIDVAAEIEANRDTFADYDERARAAGIAVVPAMAFYGGIGDLLVSAVLGDWTDADAVHIAYGLSGWHPTEGTRVAGAVSRQRRAGQHVSFHDGRLQYGPNTGIRTTWAFPEPLGPRAVMSEFSMADIVTIPRHLTVREINSYMTTEAADELTSPDTPAPVASDESGASDQTFTVDVVVERGGERRRATASGRDIYAVTAPLAVEAASRVLAGHYTGSGAAPAGAMFDAGAFLDALAPDITWTIGTPFPA